MGTIDWGNAPAWIGAVATPASVFIALRALRKEATAERWAQASQVYVHFELRHSDGCMIEVTNHSSQPISGVTARGGVPGHMTYHVAERLGILPPTQVTSGAFQVPDVDRSGAAWVSNVIAHVTFVDAGGRRWVRELNGAFKPYHQRWWQRDKPPW